MLTLAHNISEAVRQSPVRGVKTRFDWREFVRLSEVGYEEDGDSSPRARAETASWYARIHLRPLGKGATRLVYLLSSRVALKVARDEGGIEQNRAEAEASSRAQSGALIARVLSHDPDCIWLRSELVRPLKSAAEFERLTGCEMSELMSDMRSAQRGEITEPDEFSSAFAWRAWLAVRAGDLELLDVKRPEHWGATPDDRVVILDYGYTRKMHSDVKAGMFGWALQGL